MTFVQSELAGSHLACVDLKGGRAEKGRNMLGKHFLLGGLATALLGWRMVDPKGSYAALYDVSHYLTDAVAGYEVLTRLISLVLVDQFNGLMLGVAVTAFFYVALGALRQAATWPMRRRARTRVPLSRYAVPKRMMRAG